MTLGKANYFCKMNLKRAVVIWLVCGLILVYFQIIIGGITRLTGSGLSITKWEIVTGSVPPLSEKAWIREFEKYKATPQYKKINVDMELGSVWNSGTFKFIYFWEYFHRLWAKSMGFIFLFPFIFFYWKKWLPATLKKDLGVVVGLAGLAAVFGWIMVASGLVNRPWVNAYKLSIHLCIGIGVFSYLLWGFLKYIHRGKSWEISGLVSNRFIWVLFVGVLIQLFLGGIMSGMKAALIYPTWPDIGGSFIPTEIFNTSNWTLKQFMEYDSGSFVFSLMHVLHRSVAYLLTVLVIWYALKYRIWNRGDRIGKSFKFVLLAIFLQVVIGIITLVNSIGIIPVFWGVLHQAMAVIFMGTFLIHLFYVRYESVVVES
ncbi:MAG: cytochrome c oxidase assembly protein subunit 15 [Saprospiraceae bacterium]